MSTTDKEDTAGNGIESDSNSRTSNTPGVSSVNTITNSVLDADSMQSSAKLSVVVTTNEAMSANKNNLQQILLFMVLPQLNQNHGLKL